MRTSLTEETSLKVDGHLIGRPDTDWAFWRWFGLRGAGFPAADILRLAALPEVGEAADRVQAALQAKDSAFARALRQVNSALDSLRQNGQWDDREKRDPLLKAKRKLQLNQVPTPSPETDSFESIRELRACCQDIESAQTTFRERFAKSFDLGSKAIAEIAASPRFREALTWQNRRLAGVVIDALRKKQDRSADRNSRLRQREEVAAAYIQRYCVKNDTIGFFGPVGWGRLAAEGDRITTVPGRELVTARRTYWEAWPIEKLASVISRDPGVLPWVPPIAMPFLRLEGETLHHPVLAPVQLTAGQAAVLRLCRGIETAREIAGKMLRLSEPLFKNEDEVYACLTDLAARRFIFREIYIPADAYPERALRAALEKIGDPDLRSSWLAIFDELERAKRSVEASAGDAEKLDTAFSRLEEVFTRLTDAAATRHAGKLYAGRTMVYEDCRRDIDVSLGPELLKELAGPLSIMLAGARWITSEIREVYRKRLQEVHTALVAETGRQAIDVALFWTRLKPAVIDTATTLTLPVQQEFHARWSRIFDLRDEDGPVRYSSEHLRDRVLAEFPPGDPGRMGARYHSPDIMIAASDEDAIRRGEYIFVLGELHLSANTLASSLFVQQHPSPEELLEAVSHDLGPENLVPISAKNPLYSSRMESALIPSSNLRLEFAHDAFGADRSRVLPASSMVIEFEEGKLMAKTRDGRYRFEAVDAIRPPLMAFVIDSFKMGSSRSHSPRVSIDRLVIRRESWRCEVSELDFAREPDSAGRYAQTRKWRLAQAMPRFVFISAPVEPKPCYLDFESPILIDIFCKIVRRTQETGTPGAAIEISEMIPGPDQVWLRDIENNRYTSELRIVAVDLNR